MLSVPIASNYSGVVNDLTGLAAAVHEVGGYLFVDASQAVGQLAMDFDAIGADALYFPARKWLRGPKGISALILSDMALDQFGPPSGPDIRGFAVTSVAPEELQLSCVEGAGRFESFDHSPALRLGLAAAIRKLNDRGAATVQRLVGAKGATLRAHLGDIAGISFADQGTLGLVCFRIEGHDSDALASTLWKRGVNCAAISSKHAPLGIAPGHSLLRWSAHEMTADAEIEAAVAILREVLGSET